MSMSIDTCVADPRRRALSLQMRMFKRSVQPPYNVELRTDAAGFAVYEAKQALGWYRGVTPSQTDVQAAYNALEALQKGDDPIRAIPATVDDGVHNDSVAASNLAIARALIGVTHRVGGTGARNDAVQTNSAKEDGGRDVVCDEIVRKIIEAQKARVQS